MSRLTLFSEIKGIVIKMEFTLDDIVNVFNKVGFESIEEAVASLSLSNSFLEAGFTDPTVLTPVLKRFKLINEKMELQTKAAILQASQQSQITKVVEETNPPIGELNNQINVIDTQLAQLQG
jgi:hypothetical protein